MSCFNFKLTEVDCRMIMFSSRECMKEKGFYFEMVLYVREGTYLLCLNGEYSGAGNSLKNALEQFFNELQLDHDQDAELNEVLITMMHPTSRERKAITQELEAWKALHDEAHNGL